MKYKIPTRIAVLDEILNGGLSIGYVTEFAGSPWRHLKVLLHKIVVLLVDKLNMKIFYNQYFDGLDPYLLNKHSILHKVSPARIEEGIELRRSFKPNDYIKGLEHVSSNEFIILVDPFLNISRTETYPLIYERIRRLVQKNVTIVIFNRISSSLYPTGGHIHRHSIHYLVIIRQVDRRFFEVSLVKSIDSPTRSFYVEYHSLFGAGGKSIQYALSRWVR